MHLTYRGTHYETELGTIPNGVQVPVIGKYRGVEFLKTATIIPSNATYQRKYRGVTY
jgi:hypothetical protein